MCTACSTSKAVRAALPREVRLFKKGRRPNPAIDHPDSPGRLLAGIAAIRPNLLQAREAFFGSVQHGLATILVLDIGRMDHTSDRHSQDIDQDVPLARCGGCAATDRSDASGRSRRPPYPRAGSRGLVVATGSRCLAGRRWRRKHGGNTGCGVGRVCEVSVTRAESEAHWASVRSLG